MKETFFENIRREIINTLKISTKEINAMLAWFTDEELSMQLLELAKKGIKISIILSNSEWNLLNKKHLEKLIDNHNVEIRGYGSISPIEGNFMHRKLCIIDKKIVISGSFNWTKNATRNQEDVCINYDEKDAENCLREFSRLWQISKTIDFEYVLKNSKSTIEELMELEKNGISPEIYHNQSLLKNHEIMKSEERTICEPIVANKGILLLPYEYSNFSFELFHSERIYEQEQLFIANENILIWGIEVMGTWLKLKFEFNNNIYNVAVGYDSFKEVLKTNKELFIIWHKFKQKFPLSIFNCNNPFIMLEAPIKFSTTKPKEGFRKCKLKLITEEKGLICQKIFINDLNMLERLAGYQMGLF